jgi:methionyl-tRNA formyltransferase
LRVVFFGTPEFAVPTLDGLLASRHAVVGVVTRVDRPRGRGQKTTASVIKQRALAAGLPVLQPERLSDPAFLSALAALGADLGVVVAYGKILTDAVLAIPRLGFINVHGSLLPRYRGAAPVHRAVIHGDRETGVTIMRVVRALDAGPMLASARRAIGADDTSQQVEVELARLGAQLLVSSVDRLAIGPVEETPQDDAAATYASRLTKDEGLVDWSLPAEFVHNRIRGLHPWPHAFTFLGRSRLILLRSTWTPGAPLAAPGTILEAEGDRLRIAAGDGSVDIAEIQAEGSRPMAVREFLAGHRLPRGEVLGSAP